MRRSANAKYQLKTEISKVKFLAIERLGWPKLHAVTGEAEE
jgi:hypothetical protein